MTDPFLRDALGTPYGLNRPAPVSWTRGAKRLFATYLIGLPPGSIALDAHKLRCRTEAAARSQQYPTVSETTLRAQIAQLAGPSPQGETRR